MAVRLMPTRMLLFLTTGRGEGTRRRARKAARDVPVANLDRDHHLPKS